MPNDYDKTFTLDYIAYQDCSSSKFSTNKRIFLNMRVLFKLEQLPLAKFQRAFKQFLWLYNLYEGCSTAFEQDYITQMDKQQKLEYQNRIENYLAKENIYDLFEDLVKQLIVKQPDDPISFLIDKLSSPSIKNIFIIGPPGFKVREFALQVGDYYKFTTISVGDLLKKEVSKKQQLGQEIESYLKNYTIVKDQIVIKIVKKQIEGIQKEKKSFILSGYPRTRVQGLALQREGIFPDAFIILNMPEDKVLHYCEEKFKVYEKTLDKAIIANRATHIANHAQDYLLNVKQIKEIYPNNYFEIDCSKGSREEILQDIARLLKFKIKAKRPKRPASVLVVGGSQQTRTNVVKRLAKRYGFVLVMAREQLAEQIAKNTEVGRLVLDNIRRKTLVKDSIMNGLIQSRLSQVDAQMQGFVLQGYPRTEGQVVSLKDTYIQPSLIAVIEEHNTTAAQVMKHLNEKHQGVILKIASGVTEEQAFEKICFHLENS